MAVLPRASSHSTRRVIVLGTSYSPDTRARQDLGSVVGVDYRTIKLGTRAGPSPLSPSAASDDSRAPLLRAFDVAA